MYWTYLKGVQKYSFVCKKFVLFSSKIDCQYLSIDLSGKAFIDFGKDKEDYDALRKFEQLNLLR